MAPIPQKQKVRPKQARPVTVPTSNVYDNLDRTLDTLLRKQKRTDRQQREDITVNRQHAQQYESDTQKNNLIYRDVFPGRKYKLTLSDITWIDGDNVLTIGYVVGDTFNSISFDQDGNEFSFELPSVAAIDYVEIRLTGASNSVRGYLEDNTSASGIWNKIKELIQDILGLKNRIETLENQVSQMQSDISGINDEISGLDNRVSALEGN